MPFYGSRISPHLYKTREGYLVCKDVPIGRAGILKYTQDELGLGSGDKIFKVVRTVEENSQPQVCASFEGKPITDGHPDVDVDTSNFQYYAKGHIQNVHNNGEYLIADLFITDDILIDDIMSGRKRDVSCGYDTQYIQDSNGKFYQTNIRGNHLAVVETGRAGSTVRIHDALNKKIKQGVSSMPKNIQQILADFDKKIKTVRTVDEFNELVDQTSEEMEATKDAVPPQAPAPADPMGGGGDMAGIMQAIKSLSAKVDQLMTGQPTSDGTPEGDIDKAIAELQGPAGQPPAPAVAPQPPLNEQEGIGDSGDPVLPDDDLSMMDEDGIEGEVINEDDEGRTSAKVPDPETTAVTVDGEEKSPKFKIPEDNTVAKDTALNILRAARQQIAGMTNPEEKRRVTDAILKGVSSIKNTNNIKSVMKMHRTADSVNNESIQKFYHSQNPHMKKKYGIK